jgi:hypothetical protein
MRGMAIRAKECSFQYSVPGRKEKFELDFPMARETKVGFLSLQEFRQKRRSMHPMAIIAAHRTYLVGTSLKLEKFFILLMTSQAYIRSFLGCSIFERNDEIFLSSGIDMFHPGPVAGLATFSIRRCPRVNVGYTVGVFFIKGLVELKMAALAGSRRKNLYVIFDTRLP